MKRDHKPSDIPADRRPAATLMPAPRYKRFLNLLIDTIAIYAFILFMLMIFAIVVVAGSQDVKILDKYTADNPLMVTTAIALYVCYYLFFEFTFCKTPGKLLTRTRVVTKAGERPSFWAFFLRTLFRHIPFEPFSLIFRQRPVGWHDSFSRTLVVDDSEYRKIHS